MGRVRLWSSLVLLSASLALAADPPRWDGETPCPPDATRTLKAGRGEDDHVVCTRADGTVLWTHAVCGALPSRPNDPMTFPPCVGGQIDMQCNWETFIQEWFCIVNGKELWRKPGRP